MYGNVCERVADTYARDYYKNSPKEDPVGAARTRYSIFEYTINAPKAGTYALTALVVANNYNQTINVLANGEGADVSMAMPFTCGQWKEQRSGDAHSQAGREHPAVFTHQSAAGRNRRQVVHLEACEVGRSHNMINKSTQKKSLGWVFGLSLGLCVFDYGGQESYAAPGCCKSRVPRPKSIHLKKSTRK